MMMMMIPFYSNNATRFHHFTQYAGLPHNREIVLWPQIIVTSLHPMYGRFTWLCIINLTETA